VILHEPATAVDVIVEAEILQKILELRRSFGFSVIFIIHALRSARWGLSRGPLGLGGAPVPPGAQAAMCARTSRASALSLRPAAATAT
jgi:ABC-type nitrate/sulfonate/bicarbonate transport system ATPase subunit